MTGATWVQARRAGRDGVGPVEAVEQRLLLRRVAGRVGDHRGAVVLEGEQRHHGHHQEGDAADDRHEQGQERGPAAGLGHAAGQPAPDPGGVLHLDHHGLGRLGSAGAPAGAGRGVPVGGAGREELAHQASAGGGGGRSRLPGRRRLAGGRLARRRGLPGRGAGLGRGPAAGGGGDRVGGPGRAGGGPLGPLDPALALLPLLAVARLAAALGRVLVTGHERASGSAGRRSPART